MSEEEKGSVIVDSNYKPHSESINALLTDLYQITMAYAYWKSNHINLNAVFDLFFRKCPFNGEYCVFAGLDEVLRFLNTFKFSEKDIQSLKKKFPLWDVKFWDYLATIDSSSLRVLSHREGDVCFPRVPLLRIEGPLIVCQLLETTLLNLVNYPSLVATNAARMRHAVGDNAVLMEFGLRRAQGPDGAMSASRYSYIGGFNSTSNVLAGVTFDIPISGTHAHSFVTSFAAMTDLDENAVKLIPNPNSEVQSNDRNSNFIQSALHYRDKLTNGSNNTNNGELAAFIAFASAFPSQFLALIDTYDSLKSGLINFMAVALSLYLDFGYKPIGIRLDSGDLAYLSKETRKYFKAIASKYDIPSFAQLTIVASSDINEDVIYSLIHLKHEIDAFGIGTHLVTCQKQPALGCVYKLVDIDNKPRIKISQDFGKMTIPGKKLAFRLFDADNSPILDIMTLEKNKDISNGNHKNDENINNNNHSYNMYNHENKNGSSSTSLLEDSNQPPLAGRMILCQHPTLFNKRCKVTPSKVSELLIEVWNGKCVYKSPSLDEVRKYCMSQVKLFREDYLRSDYPTSLGVKEVVNPTPYKVSVAPEIAQLIQVLWTEEIPIVEFK